MKLILISILLAAQAAYAQVGIGTTNPSSNSVLDLTSPDKGLLLPRVNDTSTVSNPSAGLMIYDINAHSPAFHNGTNWNSLTGTSAMPGAAGDSITYSFFGPVFFVQGTFPVRSISYGASTPGSPSFAYFQDVNFVKYQDINSINFWRQMIPGTLNGGIEFKMYRPGESAPIFSVKLTDWYVASVQQGMISGGEASEQISVSATGTIGFKDWINNVGFTYNLTTHVIINSY